MEMCVYIYISISNTVSSMEYFGEKFCTLHRWNFKYIYIYIYIYEIENLQFPSMEFFFCDQWCLHRWKLAFQFDACLRSFNYCTPAKALNIFVYTSCTVMLIHVDLNEYFFVCYPANIYTAFENFHLWNFNFWDSPNVSNSHLTNSHVVIKSWYGRIIWW